MAVRTCYLEAQLGVTSGPLRTQGLLNCGSFPSDDKAVDVYRYTQDEDVYFFVDLMGLSFVTDVTKIAARFEVTGDLSYIIDVLYRTMRLKLLSLDMEIDGHIISGKKAWIRTTPEKVLLPDREIFGVAPT